MPHNDPGFFGRVRDGFVSVVRPRTILGVGGTPIFSGYLTENEKNPSLTGREKYKTYSDILANTSIVAAGTRYFLNLVSKATWRVEPADESARAKELAERLEEIMHDMETPWHRVVRRASMYRFYGFSIQEWTAKLTDDGVIGMLDVAPRAQITIERWDMDEHGKVFGVVQRSPQTSREIYLPRGKIIYAVDDTLNDSPEGLGLFRHLAEPNAVLNRYRQLEGFGFDADMRGIPIGRIPMAELQRLVDEGKISSADKTAAEKAMRDIVQNHINNPQRGIIMDSLTYTTEDDKATPSNIPQWDLSVIKGDPTSAAEVAAAIERLNREMARVLGVESLLLGTDSRGSHALARDKTQTFALMVEGTLQEMEEVMESDFRNPVWELNGWPEELKPQMKTEPVQYRDIEQITGALKDLAQAGAVMMPDDPAINQVRDLLGLSRQDTVKLLADLALLVPESEEESIEEEGEEEEEEVEKTVHSGQSSKQKKRSARRKKRSVKRRE